MSKFNLVLIVIVGLMSTSAQSMRFDLQSGSTKCISEDIKTNAMTVGKYSIVNPNEGYPLPDTYKLTVRAGDYTACFWAPDHRPVSTLAIEFEWKTGVAAKDWSKVAKKGHIEMMELELKKLYDTVTSIHEEMFYLREREGVMQLLNRSTNSKMATLGFFSLLVCLSVAGLQLWHLKTFFERKKLL